MTIHSQARLLIALWKSALNILDSKPFPTSQDYAIEEQRYDTLVDFVEANDLNYTKYDPRGGKDE